MRLTTSDDLKAAFYEMLQVFVPSEKAPHDKQFVKREFECVNPEARQAAAIQQITVELIQNIVCPKVMAHSIVEQGIAPCDICEIVICMHHFDALYELDDNGEPTDVLIKEDYWLPAFRVNFRPTNGWEPT